MKKIIIVPEGGIANRMRAIASGFSLASETGRDLQIVWHKDAGLNANFSDIFSITGFPCELKEISYLPHHLFYEIPRKKNLYMPFFLRRLNRTDSISHLGSNERYILDKDLKTMVELSERDVIINSGIPFYDFKTSLMKTLFQVSKDVENRKREILKGERVEIAVQIRRTDNKIATEESPLNLFEGYIKEEIKKNNAVLIYLATDDGEIKRKLSLKFSRNLIFNDSDARRDTRAGIIDGMAELDIISGCPVIYGSYWSSYSEVAAMRGESKLITVRKS